MNHVLVLQAAEESIRPAKITRKQITTVESAEEKVCATSVKTVVLREAHII